MTPERFTALLQAYGADPRHWAEAERAEAQALLAAGPPVLRQQLQEAAWLDAQLGATPVAAPDEALIARIAAGAQASAARSAPQAARWRSKPVADAKRWRPRWWWSGAGLAGVGLAGALAGVFTVTVVLRGAAQATGVDWAERATAFSEPSADWSEE
jgi:hypothetical protein